jgi:hypothetical protein
MLFSLMNRTLVPPDKLAERLTITDPALYPNKPKGGPRKCGKLSARSRRTPRAEAR